MSIHEMLADAVIGATYMKTIDNLRIALEQHTNIMYGDEPTECAICHNTEHSVHTCPHNPMYMMNLGAQFIQGHIFRCFHCGGVFNDRDSAREHFGDEVEIAVRCIQLRDTPARERIHELCVQTLKDRDASWTELRRALYVIRDACAPDDNPIQEPSCSTLV
jgi:hypothetical protein